MKNYLLFLLLSLSIVALQSFSTKNTSPSDKTLFTYVSYEYGRPLQKQPDGFGIRRIYEVYETGELKVIDRLYDSYEITRNIKLDDALYQKLLNLTNLKSFRKKKKLEKGYSYAGAYEYIEVRNSSVNEELCFILPLVSNDLKELINAFYKINLETGQQNQIKETPTEVALYRDRIVPIHKISKLPLVELPQSPPPPM
jgi:hypothetical protein